MVADGAAAVVVAVDAFVFVLIIVKHRRERLAKEAGSAPVLRG